MTFKIAGIVIAALWAAVTSVHAQTYPNRPIQVIIPMGPGTATDLNGRILLDELKRILKTEIIILNKPGASMTVGTDLVVKSKKDGYTLLYTPATGITYSKALEPEIVPYDPIKDLQPLGLHAFFPVGIGVRGNAPWKNFNEFVEDGKKNPGKIRIASAGVQTTSSLNVVIVESLTGSKFTEIPYKDGQAIVPSMLGGHVDATTQACTLLLPFVQTGQARILLTSMKMKEFPNIPTLDELGYKQELFSSWFGMYAPIGIPEEVTKVLVPVIKKAINDPAVIEKVKKVGGCVVEYRSPEELKNLAIKEIERITAIAIKVGLRK